MAVMITHAFLKELVKNRALDKRMIASLADDFVKQKDLMELARYLLSKEVVLSLLTERLVKNPLGEFRHLEGLPSRGETLPRRGRPPKSASAGVGRPRRGRPPKTSNGVDSKPSAGRKRRRLTSSKSDKLKNEIREFLKANPGSSRLQILNTVKIPSTAVYNRLMASLKETNEVVSKGEKRNAVYYLK